MKQFKEKCFKNIDNLNKVTKEKNHEHLTTAVGYFVDMLKTEEAMLLTMAECKKPGDFKFLSTVLEEIKQKWIKLEREKTARDINVHLRCIEDTPTLHYWPQLPEEAEEFKAHLGELFGGIDFSGGKVRNLEPAINK